MRALGKDFAVIHIQDSVGVDDGGKTVSDQDNGSVLPDLLDSLLNLGLGHIVQGRGRLVKENDTVVLLAMARRWR